MPLRIVAGSASIGLAGEVSSSMGVELVDGGLDPFPDGERHVMVRDVRGGDVYVIQSTGPPIDDHLVELLLLLDACRRSGAARLTAVVPYFGYARQDRRTRGGQAIGARVAAHAIAGAGADRLVLVDPHGTALEAMSPVPVECLRAVPVLAAAVRPRGPGVVVAPDLGAVRLAEQFAAMLGLPVAVVRKARVSGTEVRAEGLVGDVTGREAILVDDMIATGATIEATARLVAERGAVPRMVVAATHGLFVGDWPKVMARLGPARVVVTDTVGSMQVDSSIERLSVAPLLSEAIGRLHRDEPLGDLAFPAPMEAPRDGHLRRSGTIDPARPEDRARDWDLEEGGHGFS